MRTEPQLRITDAPSPVLIRTGSPVIVSYRGRPCLRMKFYLWVSCLERLYRFTLAGECGFRGLVVWRGCARQRLRGSAPSSAPGALRGRSPRFACPVRPLGRLSLGLVEIDAWYVVTFSGQFVSVWGIWGWVLYTAHLSLGWAGFYRLKTGGVFAPALRIRHPNTPHSTRQCRARGINHPARFP